MRGEVLNVSAYRFVALPDAPALRDTLAARAQEAQLRGTVLLAEEGLNLVLAGDADALRGWLAALQQDARFAGLDVKESWSETQPFQRLKLKVKREIIRMDAPLLDRPRAPALDAVTLARWLDQGQDDAGRPLALLDTRNAFELAHGRFHGAIDWGLQRFTQFPAAAAAHAAELAGHTVVSYCTGGIRCEKAAPLLQQLLPGTPVYQLDGGLLRYFERVGQRHFEGGCFVFDERESLDGRLAPAG